MQSFTHTSQNKKKKRLVVIALLTLLAVLFTIGVVSAYFSDYFKDDATLATDTLRINVTHTVLLNETETQLSSIDKLNPGDTIVIKGTIANTGSQSAWLRETIQFTPADAELMPYFEVYNIEIAQADLLNGEDFSQNRIAFTDGFAATGHKVLDGAGEDFVTESIGDYNYMGAAQYEFALTIYFTSSAGNEAQGKTIGFAFAAQALQFKNNNSAVPTEAAWATVATH